MRRLICGAVFAALVLVPLGSATANAAGGSVTIKKIGTKTAKYKGTVRISPNVTAKGNIQISKKTLTIKKGKKTVRKNVKAANLKAGKYKVTTRVKYRGFTNKTKPQTVIHTGNRLVQPGYGDYPYGAVDTCTVTDSLALDATTGTLHANCAVVWISEDANSNEVHRNVGTMVVPGTYDSSLGDYAIDIQGGQYTGTLNSLEGATFSPDQVLATRSFAVPVAYRAYGAWKTKSKTQSLTVKKGKKPRTCATKADFNKIDYDFDDPESYGDSKSTVAKILHNKGKQSTYSEGDGYVIEFREYKACTKNTYMSVGFFNGYAYAKSYMKY